MTSVWRNLDALSFIRVHILEYIIRVCRHESTSETKSALLTSSFIDFQESFPLLTDSFVKFSIGLCTFITVQFISLLVCLFACLCGKWKKHLSDCVCFQVFISLFEIEGDVAFVYQRLVQRIAFRVINESCFRFS